MSGKKRQSKWQRAHRPAPMTLQHRDEEIIRKVYEFSFLTREQIQRLVNFSCTSWVNIILRKLYDNRYLCRRFHPVLHGSSQAIYFIGPRSIELISEQSGVDPQEIKKMQKKSLQKKELFFAHDLSVNNVRIAFYKAMDAQENLKLDLWINATDCLHEYKVFNSKLNREVKNIFRPDGYFRYFYNDKIYSCFLELDRSTESNKRFQSKVMLYIDYARSGLYQKRYGLKYFRVLVIAKTAKRLLNLKSTIEKVTDRIFWLAAIDNVTPDKSFGQIWEKPKSHEKFSLLEV